MGAEPLSFVLVGAAAASCAFPMPIGCQTNLMVYGPGASRNWGERGHSTGTAKMASYSIPVAFQSPFTRWKTYFP